jgi:hypothetical protein
MTFFIVFSNFFNYCVILYTICNNFIYTGIYTEYAEKHNPSQYYVV